MSNVSESPRRTRARERARREAERARDPVAYRSKLAMERLRDLLAEPWWTEGAATYIFSGLHPELTEGEPCGHWGPTWLPGARDAYAPREDTFQHGVEVEAALEKCAEVCTGEARSPGDWLKRAEHLGLKPPWLALALLDPVCSPRMPAGWRKRGDDLVAGWKHGQRGANARWEGDEAHETLRDIERVQFREWFSSNQRDGVLPRGLRESFIVEVVAEFASRGIRINEGTLRTKLTRWVQEAKRSFERA